MSGKRGFRLLQQAVSVLLSTVVDGSAASVLWSVQYEQRAGSTDLSSAGTGDHILKITPPPMDLAFDDSTLDRVKEVWQKIMGDGAEEFLVFEDREAYAEDDE